MTYNEQQQIASLTEGYLQKCDEVLKLNKMLIGLQDELRIIKNEHRRRDMDEIQSHLGSLVTECESKNECESENARLRDALKAARKAMLDSVWLCPDARTKAAMAINHVLSTTSQRSA